MKTKKIFNLFSVVLIFSVYALSLRKPEVKIFQSDSEILVKKSIELSTKTTIMHHGGFMIVPKELGYNTFDAPYYSQFGLQYKLLSIPSKLFKNNINNYYKFNKLFLVLLLSIVLSLFIKIIGKEFGNYSKYFLLFGIITSPWLIKFSSNLYWFIFLDFSPFVFSWFFYKKKHFYSGIFILILIKSLCGYEYLSNILLSSIIPVIYWELKNNSKKIKDIIKPVIKTFILGFIGFLTAFTLNLIQASLYLHSIKNGLDVIKQSLIYRTIGDALGKKVDPFVDLQTFFSYLNQKSFIFINHYQLIGLVLILYIVINFLYKKINKKNDNKLFLITMIGLFFSLSWNSIALGHMRYHIHINTITFYIPFDLLAFAYIGQCIYKIKEIINKIK